ncbi:MAG: hypothetical protein IKC65_05785 [Lentisphaeria bacterium]|nr:hypothetical protein [Lentisphaeria bacterium]
MLGETLCIGPQANQSKRLFHEIFSCLLPETLHLCNIALFGKNNRGEFPAKQKFCQKILMVNKKHPAGHVKCPPDVTGWVLELCFI